jgi:hypothetical protein
MPHQETAIARGRACPLCGTASGQPCQPKPSADHLARYLDAYTAGQLTKAYMAMMLGELVVLEPCIVIAANTADESMVGRIVVRYDDDSPCPLAGLVTGQADEDRVEVAWADEQFRADPRTVIEWTDQLRPVG